MRGRGERLATRQPEQAAKQNANGVEKCADCDGHAPIVSRAGAETKKIFCALDLFDWRSKIFRDVPAGDDSHFCPGGDFLYRPQKVK